MGTSFNKNGSAYKIRKTVQCSKSCVPARVRVTLGGNRTTDVLREAEARSKEIDNTLRLRLREGEVKLEIRKIIDWFQIDRSENGETVELLPR